jgi:hypothetical protein
MTSHPEGEDFAVTRAQVVKEEHEQDLLRKANVIGVGIGLRRRAGVQGSEVAIVVLVRRKVPRSQLALDDILPGEIDGVPIDIQEVGEIRAL